MIECFIADDLSGALDAAAAFHHAGRRVRVVLSPDAWTREAEDDVIGITTETRNLDATSAAQVVRRALAHAEAQGGRLVYKKIDSTLRGPVAAELMALAAALPETRVLFTPANPGVGRTVRDGLLFVHGTPLAETEFARDPVSPVKSSSIRALLGEAAAAHVTIADAQTENDLATVVAAMDAGGPRWVGVGSGALAHPVAARLKRSNAPPATEPPSAPPGPALMICGSAHPRNRAQAAALARDRGVPWRVLEARGTSHVVESAVAEIRAGRGAALLAEEDRRDSAIVLQAVTAAVARIQMETAVARVFVTGGETAFAICRALGVRDLIYRSEIESGLGLSWARRANGLMLLAVKPGGFGGDSTWIRAWDAMTVT